MAGKRYSRIIQATRYYAAVDNLIKYWTDSTKRGLGVGKGTARPKSQDLYIRPFAAKLLTGQLVKCSAGIPAWTAYKSAFTGYTTDTSPGTAGEVVKLADYSPARVSVKKNIANVGTVASSKSTGLKRLDYGGTSSSVPFGDKIADPGKATEASVFEILEPKFNSALVGGTGGIKATWIREKY